MNQINKLESPMGTQLTAAGRSFYKDAKKIIRQSEQAIARARQIAKDEQQAIRVGTSIKSSGFHWDCRLPGSSRSFQDIVDRRARFTPHSPKGIIGPEHFEAGKSCCNPSLAIPHPRSGNSRRRMTGTKHVTVTAYHDLQRSGQATTVVCLFHG